MGSFRNRTGKHDALLSHNQKALGRTIRSIASGANPGGTDGDGDGFITGPDGEDNIPAVAQAAADTLKDAWNEGRAKQLARDEGRAIKAVQRARQNPPSRTPAQVAELLRGVRSREDARDARAMVDRWARSIFEMEELGDDRGYSVRIARGSTGVKIVGRKSQSLAVHEEDEPYLQVRVSGGIYDKNGQYAGVFERYIYLDSDNKAKKPHVYNSILRINDEHKGKGVGADFTLASEVKYAQMGIDEMRLNAGLSDGTYTWLRAGYNFKKDEDRADFASDIEKRYQQMLKDAGSKEALVAGGFSTSVGHRWEDDAPEIEMPEPLFSSMEELELFLKFLGRAKSAPLGSEREIHPSAFTMFGPFSRQVLRGLNFDLKKPISPLSDKNEQKSIVISGVDKLVTRV